MDKTAAQHAMGLWLPKLKTYLGLDTWNIDLELNNRIEAAGECELQNYAYRCAVITVNHDNIQDHTTLFHTLRHELLHILLAQFVQTETMVAECVAGKSLDLINLSFTDSTELAITNIEFLLNRIDLDFSKSLIRMAEGVRND
ncbi:hypothetical protein KS4_23370 [Poriferisphaera corsica]|uniref:Uncharacterized protein n=1 Tax=Poriferisphaera corsica TaxID=2528020 RepID=A0A517YVM5_9BACT|nr:hypothetical protein [Poriferisphaera corsica]QDU34270.1 hypothetical protein KS4_23370 [Poriferisphaera corsica]